MSQPNEATKKDENEKDEQCARNKPLPETLPRPTVWPATVALGSTLLAFGVVTHWIMSLTGLGLFLLGAGGWIKDLRNDQLQ